MENNRKETELNGKMEGKRLEKDFVTTVANPIYDTVFKYLMEDERIDFGATVRETDAPDMQHIVKRLLKAAASAEMRRRMDIEDEILSGLEKRDTIILQKNKQIEEQSQQLEVQSQQLEVQSQQLTRQKELLRNSVNMMLSSGVPIDTISKSLGLSAEEIENLQ